MTALKRVHRQIAEPERLWLDHGRGEWALTPPRAQAGWIGWIEREAPLVKVLELAADLGARSVHLVGPRPGGDVAGFHAWKDDHGAGWWSRGDHYLRDLLTPVLRYEREGGPQVDVRSGGEWLGDHARPSLGRIIDGLALVRRLLAEQFEGAALWVSPQATGTDLLLRSLPAGGEWPPLPLDVQDQIRASSTQGRIETWPAARLDPPAAARWLDGGLIPALVEYDGRFSYAALCAELAEGEPRDGGGWPDPAALGYRAGVEPVMVRGRYLVEWRAPKGWAHVGILPYLGAGGWAWPADRRWRQGWVDGAELIVAMRYGWEVKVRRHFVWPAPAAGGPLRAWADRLVSVRDIAAKMDPEGLAPDMLRAILLTTVGVLHGKGHRVTRTARDDRQLPKGRKEGLRREGGRWLWEENAGPARPAFAHPEWSAAIWARCRARLLDGPAGAPGGPRTGALHLDPATIVGFSVDALYLTEDPGWPDDGRVGRLRRKQVHAGPLPAPRDRSELLALLRGVRA